jgi:phospholipid-binding lipoprotein MlaA
MTRPLCALLLLATALLCGCATQPGAKQDPRDPFERVNRATFKFNDAMDRAALRPVAKGYRKVTPHFVQTGVSNFMDNLETPLTLVNDLLQGKFKATLNDTGRLLLNTTLGLAGLLDPASDAGLAKNDEDFGQTFGKWGVRPGPYLMLPLLGPSDLRDGAGRVPDSFANPLRYVDRDRIRLSLYAVSALDSRARLLDVDDTLNQAYDRYAFLRNAYLQRREYRVTDGEGGDEAIDEEALLKESEEP